MNKEEYINHLDTLINNIKNCDYGSYIYRFNSLSGELGVENYILDYDIYRRRLGLDTFYGTGELKIEDDSYEVRTLIRYNIYKENLLFIGSVRFKPENYKNTMSLNNETVSYEIDSYGNYSVGYPVIRKDSYMFFDIKNRKMITLEDSEFAEYTEN